MNTKRLIFLFFDGVGIGRASNINPFYAARTEWLPFYGENPQLPDHTPIKPIDATLGIQGIPMSATGQTALFTGVNAPALLCEHRDSFPDQKMRRIIRTSNLFLQLKSHNISARFLNAYPDNAHLMTRENIRIREDGEFAFSPIFPMALRNAISVTTCMLITATMKPFMEIDIIRKRALCHDFTNQPLINLYPLFRPFTPEEAAEIIYNASRDCRLTLYEYFLTDIFGHSFEPMQCRHLAENLNRLVKRLISLLNPENDILLITSDHGNMENLASPSHTRNPVPLLLWGSNTASARERIQTIADITPAVLELLTSA